GTGSCQNGQQACNAAPGSGSQSWTTCGQCGALATCTQPVTAVAELCDIFDNDCDGIVNNGNPGGGASCTNSSAQGVCRAGTQTCLPTGTLACVSNVQPGAQAEVCDGLDNDCDGAIDEAGGAGSPPLSRVCFAGAPGTFTGACPGSQAACVPRGLCRGVLQLCPGDGGAFPTCDATSVGADGGTQRFSAPETCDGQDNDCDGLNDDGNPGGGAACKALAAQGVCRDGALACTGGSLMCQAGPSSTEVCDGLDNDCDGDTDESAGLGSPKLSRTCYTGPAGTFSGVCGATPGPTCSPLGICRGVPLFCTAGAFPTCSASTLAPDGGMQRLPETEVCDGVDNDCDGALNEGLSGMACTTGLPGVCAAGTQQCQVDGGSVCVRTRDAGPETCNALDDDCNGVTDDNVPPRACFDGPTGTFVGSCGLSDGGLRTSGAGGCSARGVCRASTQQCNGAGTWLACGVGAPANQQQVLPAPETCNNADDDCNGTVDNGLFVDADNDTVRACGTCGANPDGGCDCNDGNANVRPGRIETCNGLDDNCNGQLDEASTGTGKISQNCYSGPAGTAGRGDCVQGTQSCNAAPGSNAASFGACMGERVPSVEVCNTRDDDCDGVADDGFDVDNDGFRACMACGLSTGCDCDDSNAGVRPGAVELCDAVDQNCDGRLDDVTPRPCFSDAMGVNPPPVTYFGNCPGPTCQPRGVCRAGVQSCSGAGAWGNCAGPTLPRPERCDGADDDCDGVVDNGLFDRDLDSFVSCALCASRPADAGACDCNDVDPAIKPGAPEVCDAVDNDCNGTVDGNNTACFLGPPRARSKGACRDGAQVCAAGMGQGACAGEVLPAPLPDGGVPRDEPDGGVNDPEATCDGRDDDCDGVIDDGFDRDGDGVTTCQGDCDDGDRFNRPGAAEVCDCRDNDCDTVVD
ncbi:MAG: putative metal-binding motif-containing protein, partial [Myxococcaceae bacterium]|nr:putative metal-binding motif-containing protein [Myxococcaceae bacterium]